MSNVVHMFRTVTLRPHWFQYVINEFVALCSFFISIWVWKYCDFTYHEYALYVSIGLFILLFFKLIYLARIEYIITGEQIVILHGVFSHSTDYIELYRVVDYSQHRSLPQQLFGLKTVTIYSGDRNNSKLNMIGIKASRDVIAEIRHRVEVNKSLKGIYEITNRN